MRNALIAVCSGALMIGGFALPTRAADKDSKTVTGELVDTHCYAAGGATGEKHGSTCGAACAKSGIPVAVLSDGKAWTLATNPVALADAVGKEVRVTGEENAESQVIVPDKIEVKSGDNWKEIQMKDAHHKGGADSDKG